MEKVSKEQVEEAVRTVKELKIKAAELNGRLKDAEAVVEAYGPAGPRSGHYRHQSRRGKTGQGGEAALDRGPFGTGGGAPARVCQGSVRLRRLV